MLYGITPVHEALRAGRRKLERLHVKEGRPSPRLKAVIDLAREMELPIETRTVHEIGLMAQSKQHQGALLECGELPLLGLDEFLGGIGGKPALLLALDQVEDPQNLGGLIRTAAFLGADAVMILPPYLEGPDDDDGLFAFHEAIDAAIGIDRYILSNHRILVFESNGTRRQVRRAQHRCGKNHIASHNYVYVASFEIVS